MDSLIVMLNIGNKLSIEYDNKKCRYLNHKNDSNMYYIKQITRNIIYR
jgi:hypothetical protein